MSDPGYWSGKPIIGTTAAERRESLLVLDAAPRSERRPRQRDCLHEPPYPSEETVVIAMSDPNMVVHGCGATLGARCYTTYPHPIAECKEFVSTGRDEYAEEHRWERRP